jgi:hypothetical protein
MAVCRKYQIPHSRFMGGSGRWNELDRDKAMAYERLLAEACPKCGTLREDWVGDDGIPLAEPILAAVARHCYGCDEVERVQEYIPKKMRGAYVAIIPFDDMDEDEDEIYDPARDPVELERRQREALEDAPGLGTPP